MGSEMCLRVRVPAYIYFYGDIKLFFKSCITCFGFFFWLQTCFVSNTFRTMLDRDTWKWVGKMQWQLCDSTKCPHLGPSKLENTVAFITSSIWLERNIVADRGNPLRGILSWGTKHIIYDI